MSELLCMLVKRHLLKKLSTLSPEEGEEFTDMQLIKCCQKISKFKPNSCLFKNNYNCIQIQMYTPMRKVDIG